MAGKHKTRLGRVISDKNGEDGSSGSAGGCTSSALQQDHQQAVNTRSMMRIKSARLET